MPLTTVDPTWYITLACDADETASAISQRRSTVLIAMVRRGFVIAIEPESSHRINCLRASHSKESAITLFLLNPPAAIASVQRLC
jgi:hypothetical protein